MPWWRCCAAMLVNRFKMRSDIDSYHLGGMGCSANVVAVDMAQKLLQVLGYHELLN